MKKGQTNNPRGKLPGTKNKPEENLLKNYTHAWLLSLGQEGFNKIANKSPIDVLRIAAAAMPKTSEETPGPVTVSVNFTKA